MVGAKRIQHHLGIVVTADEHSFAVLIIQDIERSVCDDHTIAGTKAVRYEVAVIQPFLHHDQRVRAGLLDALDLVDDELRIDVGVALHLLAVELRCRALYPLMQVLAELVLA